MCGIVAAVADRNIVPVLLEGLRKLEYRGYDSAGLALINEGGLHRLRAVGRVAELTAQVEETHAAGRTGIAHTRWATHGVPCERNAHPHISGGLAVVHNGIIENHETLRARLQALAYVFTSDTDTEVVAHLIAHELKTDSDLLAAVRRAVAQLQGAYAIAVLREADPSRLVVAREGRRSCLVWAKTDSTLPPMPRRWCRSRAGWSTRERRLCRTEARWLPHCPR